MNLGRCGDPWEDESGTALGLFRCVEESNWERCRFSIRCRFFADTG